MHAQELLDQRQPDVFRVIVVVTDWDCVWYVIRNREPVTTNNLCGHAAGDRSE